MQGNYVRKPESTLFEDSPEANQRNALFAMNKELQGTYPRYTQELTAHQYLPSSSQVRAYPSYQVSPPYNYQQPSLSHTSNQNLHGQRLAQSEESGGVLSEAGTRQHTVHLDQQQDFLEQEQQRHNHLMQEEEEEMREGENDIEYIIMNLYSKMKNLEGKYIDLANFYKQELVKSSATKRQGDDENGSYGNQSVQRQLIPSIGNFSALSPQRSNRNLELEQSVSNLIRNQNLKPGKDSPQIPSERQILTELLEEKRRLEDDMKQMIALKGSSTFNNHVNHQQSPAKVVSDFNLPSKEQLQYLRTQLAEAMSEVLEGLDSATKKELSFLSTKQNEMYQLATRYGLHAQVKNESLGLWYDAKTKVSSIMGELKSNIQSKQKTISENLLSSDIVSERNDTYGSLQQQLEQMTGKQGGSTKFLEDFKKEIKQLKKKQEQHQKQVQKLKSQMKFKEGLLKEEQNKLNQLLREVKVSLNNADDQSRRLLLSGEKNPQHSSNLLMSPFERKIATYQKSAELRKQNNERSGSRGRPAGLPMSNTGTGFYQNHAYLNNPQILASQTIEQQDSVDLRLTRQKLKNFEISFDEFSGKLMLKNQDIQELERLVDVSILEQQRYIAQVEAIVNQQNRQIQNSEQRQKSKPRFTADNITTSPGNYNSSKEQERKFTELQRNNEQIYQDLRKANEKYLNQRVENNKLKDEIQHLQNSIEDLQTQLRKHQVEQAASSGGVKVSSSKRQNRHESNATSGSQNNRQNSNSSSQLARENEDLRRRVQDLEKECFSLTYYQQEMQRRNNGTSNSDPYTRAITSENIELKNKIDQLCLQVQKFMLSMRRLQRAVNNKDKDIQNLKADFEKNKKSLDIMVKEIKEKEEAKQKYGPQGHNFTQINQQQTHNSMIYGRDPRFSQESQERPTSTSMNVIQPLRNKSQAPNNTNERDNFNSSSGFKQLQQPPHSITQRPPEDLNSSNSLLPPKKGAIRAKQTPTSAVQVRAGANQSEIMQTPQPFTHNIPAPHQQQQQYLQPPQYQSEFLQQQESFNNLLEEVRAMQDERETLRLQIEDLKTQVEEERAARNGAEVLVQSKEQNLAKLNKQANQSNDRSYKMEKLVNEYKEGLQSLEQQPQLNQIMVSKVKLDLLQKEKNLASLPEINKRESFIPLGSQSLHVQTVQTGESFDKAKFEEIRKQLEQLVQQKQQELENQMDSLHLRLSEKEEDLDSLKKLFVDKLKELESSFVELSQDMIESEQVQLEASKRYQQKQQQMKQSQIMAAQQRQQKDKSATDLERSLEQIISDGQKAKYDEELQEQVNQLTQLNEQIQDENQELRMMIKHLQNDLLAQENHLQQKEQFEALQLEFEVLDQNYHKLDQKSQALQSQNTQLKQQVDKYRQDNISLQKQLQQNLNASQLQLQNLENEINDQKMILSQEQEARIIAESEIQNLAKKLKEEREKQELQLQDMREELEQVNKLREGEISIESEGILGQEEPEDQARIETHPKEAAQHYQRLFKNTKKEYKILFSQKEKLQGSYDDLKTKFDTLKQESRSNVEEIMNLETRVFDLTTQNNRLLNELDKIKGDSKAEEQMARQELEDEYKQRIAFKDQEVEQMTGKVARISQINMELTSKVSRLENNLQELTQEYESNRIRLQHLELELEMTKVDSERDLEQMMQQQQDQREAQLQQIHQEKIALQEKLQKKKAKSQQHKMALQQSEIDRQRQLVQQQKEFKIQMDQSIKETQQKLAQEQQAETQKKDKQTRLMLALQLHMKKLLEKQLSESIAQNQEIEQEFLKKEEQYEQEKKQLESLRLKELQLLEAKLKKDEDERERKFKRERSLVLVLQTKARESIRKLLEEEKQRRILEQESAKREISELIEQKQQEMNKLNEGNKLKLEAMKHKLELQSQHDQQEIKAQLQSQLDLIYKDSDQQLHRKQSEIDRLRREQQELMASMAQEQDQQTQELFASKEREKQILMQQMKEQQKSMQDQHLKEIQRKEKQTKLLNALQQRLKKDLEAKLKLTVNQLEQVQKAKEEELNKAKQEQLKAFESLQGKSKEEQERIKKEMLVAVQEKELQLQKAKEEQEKLQETLNKKKQVEVHRLEAQIQQLQSDKKLLQEQVQSMQALNRELDEQSQAQLQDLQKQLDSSQKQLKDERAKHSKEVKQLQQEHEERLQVLEEEQTQKDDKIQQLSKHIKELNNQQAQQLKVKERELEEHRNLHQQLMEQISQEKVEEMERLKQKIEADHQQIVAKKEKERTMVEKLQEKMREELKRQIEEKENERMEQIEKAKKLEQEIKVKESDIDKERKEKFNAISELNMEIEEQEKTIQILNGEKVRLQKELEHLKKSQAESENEQIRDMSEQVNKLQSKCTQLQSDKQRLEQQVTTLTAQLKQKTLEVQNLENDLGQAYDQFEEEKVRNESAQQQIKEKLDQITSARDKDRKDNDMQLKLKEGLLKQIQEQLEESERQISLKQAELQSEVELKQKNKKQVQELEAQIKALNQKYEEESDQLQAQNLELKNQIEQLKKKTIKQPAGSENKLEQSIDEIDVKLGEFDVELNKLKKQSKDLQNQKQLSDSLVGSAEKEVNLETIGDVNSKALQFCKRVPYLDKAWILISKQDQYFWVNQSNIPIDKLQKINVEEIEENQGNLEQKLNQLKLEKEKLVKLIKASKGGAQYIEQIDQSTTTVKVLELENQELKAQLNEYKLSNLALQQSTLNLKQRINELNDLIFGLADTDKSHDNINKIMELYKKREELSLKLLEQLETIQKLETENDQLKKQLSENEYSFARGGGKSFAQLKPENFDINTSSIDQKQDDDMDNLVVPASNNNNGLQSKIQRLETELEEIQKLHDAIKFENVSLREQQVKTISQSMIQQAEAQEALDNIKHIKNLFIQFLSKVPIMQAGSGEELLPVLLSMMMLNKEETQQLKKTRENLALENKVKESVKKGVLGGFFGKKQQ